MPVENLMADRETLKLHHNETVQRWCKKVLEDALKLLWTFWPQEKTLAVLLCGSWPAGMGCAEVIDGKVRFFSDFDLMVIVDNSTDVASAHRTKLKIDAAIAENETIREVDARVDFGFIKFKDLPPKAEALFWYDCCTHALAVWGGRDNPFEKIERPERLDPHEAVLLLTNRALGQIFVLPSILGKNGGLKKAIYHCGKVAIDGVNALCIASGCYEPGMCAGEIEVDRIEVPSSERDAFVEIILAAKFWENQKRRFNIENILKTYGSVEKGQPGSFLGVWLWAAKMFYKIWEILIKMLQEDSDFFRTTQNTLMKKSIKGAYYNIKSWKLFLERSSLHCVRAHYKDWLRFSWRAAPIDAARICGVIGLCRNPWENVNDFLKGIGAMRKFLPSTKAYGHCPEADWAILMDNAVSIWRVSVNQYDERNATIGDYIHLIKQGKEALFMQ